MTTDPLSTTARDLPVPGLTLGGLEPGDAPIVRRFCLDTIAEAFGHGYRPEWHDDLDRLGSADDDYGPCRRGAFLVMADTDGIVACGGLRSLAARPGLCARFGDRYPEPGAVASIWRVYVEPSHRGGGLGRILSDELERQATTLGYQQSYLHTSALRRETVSFWTSRGYRPFHHDPDCDDSTVHMDKMITGTTPAT